MFVIRQSLQEDAEQILAVAEYLDTVNLPANAERISQIVARSEDSFAGRIPTFEREYCFVLEDIQEKRVIGTSMIHAQHGTKRAPHMFFQVLKDERYSETLDSYFVHQCLRLGYDYDGPTEIGGLILLPEYRGHAGSLGKMLSYTRFLFMAMNRASFRDRVLSELLPPLDDSGDSVLWEHLGRKFTGLSYQEADMRSTNNKEFIRSLFPHSVIYTSLMPEEVQAVIGKVGPLTLGVEKILRRIGFEFAGQIDPFDGGPHFMADTDKITLVRDTHSSKVRRIDHADESRPWGIVGIQRDESPFFRAASGRLIPSSDGQTVGLPGEMREILGVSDGDTVSVVIP